MILEKQYQTEITKRNVSLQTDIAKKRLDILLDTNTKIQQTTPQSTFIYVSG
jgi:hypothetical protein